MALIRCPECGKEVSDRAASCPGCGYPIDEYVALLRDREEKTEQSAAPEKEDTYTEKSGIAEDAADSHENAGPAEHDSAGNSSVRGEDTASSRPQSRSALIILLVLALITAVFAIVLVKPFEVVKAEYDEVKTEFDAAIASYDEKCAQIQEKNSELEEKMAGLSGMINSGEIPYSGEMVDSATDALNRAMSAKVNVPQLMIKTDYRFNYIALQQGRARRDIEEMRTGIKIIGAACSRLEIPDYSEVISAIDACESRLSAGAVK